MIYELYINKAGKDKYIKYLSNQSYCIYILFLKSFFVLVERLIFASENVKAFLKNIKGN